MKLPKLTREVGFYGLAFVLAMAIRLFYLGQLPLSDKESLWALQAFDIASGNHTNIGSEPGYILSTALVFFMGGAHEWAARIMPAIVGSLIVFSPALFRNRLGIVQALTLSFVFAIEPGLVAISRQAFGLVFGLTFLSFTIGFYFLRRPALAGLSAGLALLGGSQLWGGVLTLLITLGWMFISRPKKVEENDGSQFPSQEEGIATWSWKVALLWCAGTVLVFGTLFFTMPSGIASIFASLVTYLQGWLQPWGLSPFILLQALLFYAPFAVILGLIGVVVGWRRHDQVDGFLARWLFVALILSLFNPLRQVSDLVWVLLPLWALAVRQFWRFFKVPDKWLVVSLGQAALIFTLLVLMWMTFAGMYQPNQSPEGVQIQMIRLVAAWGLIMMVSVLVAWGWSIQHAVIGLFWGVCLTLFIYSIGSSWNASGLGKRPDTELWRYGASVADADLLTKTVSDFSEWNANSRTGIDMAVVGVQSPALRWALRNMSNVEYLDSLPAGKNPSVVITSAEENLAQTVPYTGQGFIWSQNPALTLLFPGEWMHWLAVRDMPTEKQSLILWIRGDKFPGSTKIKSVNLTP